MHPNVSIILSAAILRMKDALERRASVAMAIVRHIDVSHQKPTVIPHHVEIEVATEVLVGCYQVVHKSYIVVSSMVSKEVVHESTNASEAD